MEKICAWARCGKAFEATNARQIYCCEKCEKAAAGRRRYERVRRAEGKTPGTVYTKVCALVKCGKTFETTNARQVYCCAACYEESQREAAAKRNKKRSQERKRAKAEQAKAEKAKGSLLMRVDRPERLPDEVTEDNDMKVLDGSKTRETMPRIIPKPRCKLEWDSLRVRESGAKSYGYYKAFQIIGK